MLRRKAIDAGEDAALDHCRQEGRFLAGYSVYCHPTSDRELVRKIVDLANGEWLERPPDTAFSSSVPVLILSDLPEWWAAGCQGYAAGGPSPAGGVMAGAMAGPFMGSGGPVGLAQMCGPCMGGFMAGGMPGAPWAPPGDMFMQPQPLRPSPDAYMESRLRPEDVDGYVAAGLQLFRNTDNGRELLFAHERPWNSWNNDYDPLAWNVLGIKRSKGSRGLWEINPHSTAVRCALEVIGGVEGAPTSRSIFRMCKQSLSIWYPRGKYALFLHEVTGEDAAALDNPSLSERFAAARAAGNVPPRRCQSEPRPDGSTKYTKQVEDLQWVPAGELLSDSATLTDLLENFCQIEPFRNFLRGGDLPPVAETQLDDAEDPEAAGDRQGGQAKGGKGKGGKLFPIRGGAHDPDGGGGGGPGGGPPRRGMWEKGGFDKGGLGKAGMAMCGKAMGGKAGKGDWGTGMGGKAKGDWDKGMGAKGMDPFMEGCLPGKGMRGLEKGAGKPKGPGMDKGGGKPRGKARGGWEKGKGKGRPGEEPPEEAASGQVLGERLYVLVQGLVPSVPLAQKVTGMLLELPTPELLALFEQVPGESPSELEQRVSEAMDILKEDGIV